MGVLMTSSSGERPRILLVAPNVSRFMGGEAIKALRIFEGYRALGFEVTQVAHARVRVEMASYGPDLPIVYVEDGPVQVALYKLKLNWLLDVVGAWLLHREAQRQIGKIKPWIVHFTSPISPSVPHFPLKGAPVVIGPLNGNLLHPPALLYRESKAKLLGAKLLRPTQWLNRLLFRGKHKARIFISGGERTVEALEMGGCTRAQMIHTLDSGVDVELRDAVRLTHEDVNWRFVLAGRLVRYKGCDLVIRALKSVPLAHLDVIGDGAERAALEALAQSEGVADRVHFLGFMPGGSLLFEKLRDYRAFVFPTLAEANGIVIQEAMMMGLPVVSLNWGGPAELLDASTGILLEPESEDAIVKGLAVAMTKLATQPEVAEALSRAARARAEQEGYDWPSLLRNWIGLYDDLLAERGDDRRFGDWMAVHKSMPGA
jgi:glycosyltransferase involved in cell wall biosynthesis